MDKEWHKTRIEELKIEKQEYDNLKNLIPTLIIGLGALFMTTYSIYFTNKERYVNEIIWNALFTLIVITILLIINSWIYKKDTIIMTKIKRNYDILLDRAKK